MKARRRKHASHKQTSTKLTSGSDQIDHWDYIRNDLAHNKKNSPAEFTFFHCLPSTENIFSKNEKGKINIVFAFCCCTLTGAGAKISWLCKTIGYIHLDVFIVLL